jgi:four helix bundle protein
VYQKALEAADEISAILNLEGLAKDYRLRNQLGASSERVASLIAEGFGQKTDRHFASYLHMGKGSSFETRTQLRVARGRGYISEERRLTMSDKYLEIERMLTGLIHRLEEDDRKDRG